MYCSMRKIKIVLHASAFLHLSLSASENGNLNAPPQIAETWEQAVVMPETNMDKEAGKEGGGGDINSAKDGPAIGKDINSTKIKCH